MLTLGNLGGKNHIRRKQMTLEDKIKNAKPSDLFDNIPKKKQRLIIQKNKRRLKRLKRRIRNERKTESKEI